MGLFTRSSSSTAQPGNGKANRAAGNGSGDDIVAPPPASQPMPTMVPPPPRIDLDSQPAQLTERQLYMQQLRVRIHQQLVDRLDVQNLRSLPHDTVRSEVRVLIRELCQSEKGLINSIEQEKLMDEVMDETFGLGPLETLLKDPSITDILVNRFDRIYCERRGRLEVVDVQFRDNSHLRQIIDRIVGLVGRRVDEISPMVDARLQDGSRVNAIIPPLALDGPAMSIRRFGARPLQLEDLIRHGAFPAAVMDFLAAAVQARCNVLISGGTGSGKTTLLNCLSRYSPPAERVITIEDAAELRLQQPHWLPLETRPPNLEGQGAITIRDLVINALRMRPDRIILGEIRGPECFDLLAAMNTGHDGSMATLHSNSPRECLARMENMVMMSDIKVPKEAISRQIADSVDLIVQVKRLRDGSRRTTNITEVIGMEGDVIVTQELFKFEYMDETADGKILGEYRSMGLRPYTLEKAKQFGFDQPYLEACL
jgi:pilus assembly protein CpaF